MIPNCLNKTSKNHDWLKHQEFLYSWLAPTLVDRFSTCSREHDAFSCDFDAYPLVGVGLTLVTLIFLMTQWKRGEISVWNSFFPGILGWPVWDDKPLKLIFVGMAQPPVPQGGPWMCIPVLVYNPYTTVYKPQLATSYVAQFQQGYEHLWTTCSLG